MPGMFVGGGFGLNTKEPDIIGATYYQALMHIDYANAVSLFSERALQQRGAANLEEALKGMAAQFGTPRDCQRTTKVQKHVHGETYFTSTYNVIYLNLSTKEKITFYKRDNESQFRIDSINIEVLSGKKYEFTIG